MLKIHAVGGYSEVGKNMTAVESGDDVTLCDAGLFIPALVGVSEREKIPTEQGMRAIGALPNDHYLDEHKLREKVRAIAVSHAHLDHVGAVQYLSHRYKAGVYGTPTFFINGKMLVGARPYNSFREEILEALGEPDTDGVSLPVPSEKIPIPMAIQPDNQVVEEAEQNNPPVAPQEDDKRVVDQPAEPASLARSA